jgi:hypothetical protein
MAQMHFSEFFSKNFSPRIIQRQLTFFVLFMQMQDRFQQITQADAEQRKQLGDVYSTLLAFFGLEGCTEKVEENINNQIRNCKQQIAQHDYKLKTDGCPILVTGRYCSMRGTPCERSWEISHR